MSSYVFILCPPYAGSTVLWRLMSSSTAVSSLPGEGQFLPEVKEVMRQSPWNPDVVLPWSRIKEVWDGYWDQSRPLLVEKSPPNLVRADDIVKYFHPVHFLIMVRNPYAHCEGLIRRNHWSPAEAAEFSMRCMRQQAKNGAELPHTLCFTYEELVANPRGISEKIQLFLPQTGALEHTGKFSVHSVDGVVEREIVDLNAKKIGNLSANDIVAINEVLEKNLDVMAYWGYECIEASSFA
jgi:hypothetical protein